MGNLVAAAAQGVQVEHGDQPLHLQERAALGWVREEGRLCPRGRFGPRLAKLWWWGRLDRTPPKIPPPPPHPPWLRSCPGAWASCWSCRVKVALEPRRAAGASGGIRRVLPQGLLQL